VSDATTKAVFLSYASQDAEAAKKICDALRAAGVEVWFDQSELRGGDAWDGLIRKRIKECALFVPLITPTTNARAEGYFRLEWKLAVDRSHLMADDAPFLFPIVVGDVADATARVPDKFRDVQWTRLRLDETPGELGARVAKLLGGESRVEPPAAGTGQRPAKPSHWMRNLGMIMGLTIGLVYALRPLWSPARHPEPKPVAVPAAPAGKTAAPAVSEARKIAERARALFDKIDSNADDFAVAESLLKRALELDATDGEIWAYSARLNAAYLTRSFERGTARAEAARNHAERAVKLAPESAEAWHALGRAIWRSDPPRAEEALRHALQLAPNDGRILISLGSIYRNQGRDEEALAFYVRAAAQPEVRPLALYDQFLIHLYLRRFEEADRCGREAAAALPTTNSVTGLAMLEIAWRGRVDAAQRTLDAAPATMRSEPRMVFATALAALMAKQSDGALRALDRLPGDFISDAWYSGPKALLVGLVHAQAGRPEAARIAWEAGLAVVRRHLQDTTNDPELHLRLGELLAWTGQTEAALQEARVFEELQRNRTDWTYSSARIYAALGRADDAVPILEKFLTAPATGRWPLTPALLRLDPLWDKLRGDPRFQKLCVEPAEKVAPLPERASHALVLQGREMLEKFITDDTQPETLSLAEELAKHAVQADVMDADAWSLSAQVASGFFMSGRDREPARVAAMNSAAERAMQLAPKSDEALFARALAYRVPLATRDEAGRLLRELVERNPGDRRMLRMLAIVLRNAQDFEATLAVYQQAAALPGGDARAELGCAEMLEKLGRRDEAGAAVDRSLAVQPTGAAYLFKVNLARIRGDYGLARAELAKVPPTVLLDGRGATVAANVWLWSREPEKAIAALEVIPGDDLNNAYFIGPKSLLLGFAHQLAGRGEVAKLQWRIALKNLELRAAVNPALAFDQLYLGTRMFLGFLIGDPELKAEAAQLLRVYVQLGVPPEIDPMWDPAKLFTLLGQQDIMIDFCEMVLKSGEMPGLREELRTKKLYDPLRGNPRFEALLKEPAVKK